MLGRAIVGALILGAVIILGMEFRKSWKNMKIADRLDREAQELETKELVMKGESKLRRRKANLKAKDMMSDVDDLLAKVDFKETDKREEK